MTLQKKTNSSSGFLDDFGYYAQSLLPAGGVALFSDLEVLTYIYESLKYYGFIGTENSDYSKTGKHHGSAPAMPKYVLRKILYSIICSIPSLAYVKAVADIGINHSTIVEIASSILISGQISWLSILSRLSFPYVVSGVVAPVMMNTVRGYVNQDGVSAAVKYTYKTLETTKLYYRGERRSLLELAIGSMGNSLNQMIILEPIRFVRLLGRFLRARAKREKTQEEVQKETEMKYTVKEYDDLVVIEEKTQKHKEVLDESGVLVVDVL